MAYRSLITVFALLVAATQLAAAEIHFKPECRVAGSLVLLSDVAEVYSNNDTEKRLLSELELVPAPAPGEKRVLRVREIQDLLSLRGTKLLEHRLVGASQIVITSGDSSRPQTGPQRPSPLASRKAQTQVREAVLQYLEQQSPGQPGWNVQFELADDMAAAIGTAQGAIAVRGGSAPWTGRQQLVLLIQTAGAPQSLTLNCDVSLTPTVVVATQTIAKGTIVRPSDVRLQSATPNEGNVHVFTSLDEVIGKETARVIVAGQIIDSQLVQRQLLVKRGEVVSVFARAAGIQVRTTGRARQDGSLGELVEVEAIADRKLIFARVSGPQEVDVFAQAVQAVTQPSVADLQPSRPQQPAVRQAAPMSMPAAKTTITPPAYSYSQPASTSISTTVQQVQPAAGPQVALPPATAGGEVQVRFTSPVKE